MTEEPNKSSGEDVATEAEQSDALDGEGPGGDEPNASIEDSSTSKSAEESVDATRSDSPPAESGKRRWRDRPTIRALRAEAEQRFDLMGEWDQRENNTTRLPAGEEVHIGGIVLVEAFTPSTIASLYSALEGLPALWSGKEEWIARLKSSRSASNPRGWQTLGGVRRPGKFLGGDGFHDSALPDGIDAVWLRLHYPTPSLAVLVATFTLEEDAGNLSAILRNDYQSRSGDVYIHVDGALGRLRSKIPWSRPSNCKVITRQYYVEHLKHLECEKFVSRYERDCWDWLATRFRGRFNAEEVAERPRVRIYFTKSQVAFKDRPRPFAPVGLEFAIPIWRPVGRPAWAITFDGWRMPRFTAVAAARRGDAAKDGLGDADESVWVLTQRFHRTHAPLIVRWAMSCLLSIYADRLGDLRDRAGTRRRYSSTVRQAGELDRFLLGDGLDASTVASDLQSFTKDLRVFRYDAEEYTEDREGLSESSQGQTDASLELVSFLRKRLEDQSTRLLNDMATSTANIRASAELRQAIANTILQRWVLVLAIIAAVVAVVSLVMSGE